MSIEKVRAYLEERQLADRIQEFDVSSATVELAAQALHVEGQRIAKTLSFHVGDRVALIVAGYWPSSQKGRFLAMAGVLAAL